MIHKQPFPHNPNACFVQIVPFNGFLYALDSEGNVWAEALGTGNAWRPFVGDRVVEDETA